MFDQSPHMMTLEKTHPSGADEWYCPICGRRVVLRMPQYKKIILEAGDEEAYHQMAKQPQDDFDEPIPDDDWVRDND